MKRNHIVKLLAAVGVTAVLACALGGCGAVSSTSSSSSDNVIKIGASPSPHAEILQQVKDQLAQEGYDLQIVEYSDYVQPNQALSQGELDANYFQHKPYLDNYNSQNGTDLVSAAAIHFEPMGVYAGKSSDLQNIPDGARIAVPSDATNEARALQLLQSEGVFTLKDGVGLNATKNDIVSNPHNVQVVESEAASLPRMIQDVDFAVINGNYALSGGLDTDKTLASESADSEAAQTYANIIAVQSSDASSDKINALVNALKSDTVRSFIESNYHGTVVPVF
ncbi:MAG: MetQ/NlpA family ABC transporter substrate-binding protein [Eggerthellaceae bacterium]|nr:MetQ/NlpA family ABC transporter substrate-binding protein [Eggerthellaceae bacterium]MCH4220357.1 MetQ/NlpA family ABC transporter substrate-binding protein [Eggerthellaceae bacterium]